MSSHPACAAIGPGTRVRQRAAARVATAPVRVHPLRRRWHDLRRSGLSHPDLRDLGQI